MWCRRCQNVFFPTFAIASLKKQTIDKLVFLVWRPLASCEKKSKKAAVVDAFWPFALWCVFFFSLLWPFGYCFRPFDFLIFLQGTKNLMEDL